MRYLWWVDPSIYHGYTPLPAYRSGCCYSPQYGVHVLMIPRAVHAFPSLSMHDLPKLLITQIIGQYKRVANSGTLTFLTVFILLHPTGPSPCRFVLHSDHYGVPNISRGRDSSTFLPRCFIQPLAIGNILGSTLAARALHSVVFFRTVVTRLLHTTPPVPCTSPAALPFDVRVWEETSCRCQHVIFCQDAQHRVVYNQLSTSFISRLVDLG